MIFELSEEQRLLEEQVRAFAQSEILPHAAKIDEEGRYPKAQVQGMADMGLMGLMVPEAYGGAEMDAISYVIAMEEISAACASCGVIMSVNNSLVCDPITRYGTEEQKQRWLPKLATGELLGSFALSEPGTGSDAAAQTCVATPEGDGWVLNGTKNWITNGVEADLCLVIAMTDKSQGVKGISAFLIPSDTPGYEVAKNEKKLGIKGSSTAQINLEGCKVGPEALLGEVGQGFKVAMTTLDGGRIGIAAQALGIAKQALVESRQYATEREAFGGPIAKLQAIQFKLADMATELDAARLLTYKAAWLKQNKLPYGPQSAMAKLYASEMSHRVTHQALQIYGGFGYSKEFPAERHYRDARITEIYEGTSEIQRVVIGRAALKGQLS